MGGIFGTMCDENSITIGDERKNKEAEEVVTYINKKLAEVKKELYNIDMEQTQYSKLIDEIPKPDIAISMGCNVGCPFTGRPFDDNWGLEDPTGKDDKEFDGDDFDITIDETGGDDIKYTRTIYTRKK